MLSLFTKCVVLVVNLAVFKQFPDLNSLIGHASNIRILTTKPMRKNFTFMKLFVAL